jgi:trigger factor
MKCEQESVSPIKLRIKVEIPEPEVTARLEKAYQNLQKKAKIKGFRQGKAPRAILERLYRHQVEDEVRQELINQTYPQALEETRIRPVSIAQVEPSPFAAGKEYVYAAVVEVKPAFTLEGYKGLSLETEPLNVAEEMVEKRLKAIQENQAELHPIQEDRPLRKGDFAVVDFETTTGGKPVPYGKAENYDFEVGSTRFNPKVEEELPGLIKGGEKEVLVPFPEDFANKDMAGKEVLFKVRLKEIKEKILPPLDDQLAKDLGEQFETLADLTARIRRDLEEEETKRIEAKLKNDLRDQVNALVEIEIPQAMVENQIRGMIRNLQINFLKRGMDLGASDLDLTHLSEQYRPLAVRKVKSSLTLEKIAELEGLSATDEEMEKELTSVAEELSQPLSQVREYYQKNNLMSELKDHILEEKALQFVKDHAKITQKKGSA